MKSMKRTARLIVLTVLLTGLTTIAYAQPVIITETAAPAQPNFWLAVIVGLILAVAFEMILTHLSIAAGISMVGPLDEPQRKGREEREEGEGETIYMRTAHRFSNAFGVWSLITAVISVFAATWLAVTLSGTDNAFYGLVLGLAIWGLFYLLTTVLEAAAVTSLVGSLMRTAISGLQSAYKAAAGVFAKSPEDRIADAARDVTASVRQELFGDIDAEDLRHKIDSYVQQIKPMDAKTIKKEVLDLLDDIEVRAIVDREGPFADITEISARLEAGGKMSREKAKSTAESFAHALEMIREEYRSGKRPAEKVSDAAMKAAGISDEQARATREKIERYLRETGEEALDPDAIKTDIEKLLKSPGEGVQALKDRLSHVDRSTIASVIASRTDLSRDKADQIVDRVWSVIDKLRGAAAPAETVTQGAQVPAPEAAAGVERKLQSYLDSLGRPELRYEGIKHDFMLLLHDPKAGADALLQRAKAMDRDTLKAIVASRKDLSEDDAEQIVSRMESARDEAIAKAQQMKEKVQEKVQLARERVMHEAEEARETASSAAWWTFGSAVASAAAAVAGGILAVEYF
jgi:hypothetical protein